MYLNEERKLIYVHIPKTGGRLIEWHFDYKKIGEYAHNSIHELPIEYSNYFKFATIRNPFAWYVSLYTYLQKYSNELSRWIDDINDFSTFVKNCLNPIERVKKHEHNFEVNKPTSKLYHFVQSHSVMNCGWLTMFFIHSCCKNWENILTKNKDYIKMNYQQILSVDEVIKLEELNSFKKINIDMSKKINCSNHKHYREYYNEKTKKLVRQQDSLIFELFNYQ